MHTTLVNDINVISHKVLASPNTLQKHLPMSSIAENTVTQGRAAVRDILEGKDKRIMVVVGPCSIHDPKAAIDYARRLKQLSEKVSDSLLVIMRVYFEKPRTSIGWKGLINDPELNDSFKIQEGLELSRKLLLDIAHIGLPVATEALDPITPQYIQDLISWSAIGARTTESQTHREMASGLSSAVGFKNGTDGGLTVAINALQSISNPHRFLGMNKEGGISIVHTKGNPYGHIVLRGGKDGPNYHADNIAECEATLIKHKLAPKIMVDCSHANSNKDHDRQTLVLKDVINQINKGNRSIIGVMIESNITSGNQNISNNMIYGKSVTDACIDWDTTESIIKQAASELTKVVLTR